MYERATVGETKTVATPEKKVVDEESKVVEDVDEDSKASENGDAKEVVAKENGASAEEKEAVAAADDKDDPESTENGDCTDAPADACCIKRKSTAPQSDAVDGSPAEGASPEKKAKLEEKSTADAENNGGEAEAAA
ncbi:uncharacterized protein LOC105691079 isoform X4 [Athalia rosae]|uniref:uncharacterized protein LOC105691079 isoform X4 n=1 Tax=Athalia rosae TaxID=37344 RepID=UPI002033E768|nr:uncharacterized protein LOC105691079 isoform X4 [Athalia rosae]